MNDFADKELPKIIGERCGKCGKKFRGEVSANIHEKSEVALCDACYKSFIKVQIEEALKKVIEATKLQQVCYFQVELTKDSKMFGAVKNSIKRYSNYADENLKTKIKEFWEVLENQ